MTAYTRPRLRPVEIKRLQHRGRWYFHVRDHLALAGQDLLVPIELGPALALLDGEHDLAMIRTRALIHGGLVLSPAELIGLVQQLDAALLLEGEQAEAAKLAALVAYHAAEYRPPALAGAVYPADPADLKAHLGSFDLHAVCDPARAESVAGVLSPHIDYARGGPVYAHGWRRAREAARQAELVIMLGTDHAGSGGRITLTTQRYATPWGALDIDARLQAALVQALGPDEAYAEELHHRTEHSVELAAVWLHHVRDGRPVRVLPVLCGHPGPFLADGLATEDGRLARAIEVLRGAMDRGALVVVAGDLAHVGPAFGDPNPFREPERAAVRAADLALIDACARGADTMLAEAARTEDRYRICGLTPLALALAIMPPVRLEIAGYAQCPADEHGTSFVSVAAGCFIRQ